MAERERNNVSHQRRTCPSDLRRFQDSDALCIHLIGLSFFSGDWPHERSLLQLFIAIMSGPRFALVLLSALLVSLSRPHSRRARLLAFTGTLRTLSCGGWVFCTSTDFAMVHDVAMITYLVLTPAWMYISWGSLAPQPNKRPLTGRSTSSTADGLAEKARKSRRNTAIAFFASIPFMCFFYYRHKVLLIPGAYTIYSFFEWNLIIQVSVLEREARPRESEGPTMLTLRLRLPLPYSRRTCSSIYGRSMTSAAWRFTSSRQTNRPCGRKSRAVGGTAV